MTQERIYNSGTVLGRKISLNSLRANDYRQDGNVELLIDAIREAAQGLERVSFDVDSDDGGYLEVVGMPTGELREQCVAKYQRELEEQRMRRIENAERLLRKEGRL